MPDMGRREFITLLGSAAAAWPPVTKDIHAALHGCPCSQETGGQTRASVSAICGIEVVPPSLLALADEVIE